MGRSLYSTFGVRSLLHPVNKDIEEKGVVVALKKLVNTHTSNFEIVTPPNTREALSEGKTLLICNHPAQVDVLLLLAALPPREDIYLIVVHGILSILPAIDKHLIPVYIGYRSDMGSALVYKLLNTFHNVPRYSREDSREKNIKSIDIAAKRIDEGGIVGIFPTGGNGGRKEFSPGVGYIVKNLEHPEEVKIVMAHVSGTSTWDFFRIIPFVHNLMPKLRISFSQPLDASNFVSKNGRHAAYTLQGVYENWERSLGPSSTFEIAFGYIRFLVGLLFSKLSRITV